MASFKDAGSCSKGATICCSSINERLNFSLDEGSILESYTLLYIYERFGVANVRKVVRDNDNSNIPFCIDDVEVCTGNTYTIFFDDDTVPLT